MNCSLLSNGLTWPKHDAARLELNRMNVANVFIAILHCSRRRTWARITTRSFQDHTGYCIPCKNKDHRVSPFYLQWNNLPTSEKSSLFKKHTHNPTHQPFQELFKLTQWLMQRIIKSKIRNAAIRTTTAISVSTFQWSHWAKACWHGWSSTAWMSELSSW